MLQGFLSINPLKQGAPGISICKISVFVTLPKRDFSFHILSSSFDCRFMFSLFSDASQRSLDCLLQPVPKNKNVMAFLGDASGPRITYFVKGMGDSMSILCYQKFEEKKTLLSFSLCGSLPNPPLHSSPPYHCHRHCPHCQVSNSYFHRASS